MATYYITFNEYFGYCVCEMYNGTATIIFTGSIEECNRKCIEMNEGR